MRLSLLFVVSIFLFIPPAFAKISKGDKIPDTFSAQDQSGTTQTLETLSGEKGIILVFVRSVDWCPFCQRQIIDLAQNGTRITDAGYNITTLSYDSTKILAAFSKRSKIPYTMLSDPKSEIIQTFGLLNTDMQPGTRYYGIPHPAIMIIKKDGTVQDILREDGYQKRPEISQILKAIQSQTP